MWQITPTDQYEKDTKRYEKKYPRELEAVLNNLDRYLSLLKVLSNPKTAQAGYLHPEQAGVIAVDQRGAKQKLQQTRLYTYADEASKVLYLITIGNKKSQHGDVILSRDFVHHLTSSKFSS